jgi:hypothetical protein
MDFETDFVIEWCQFFAHYVGPPQECYEKKIQNFFLDFFSRIFQSQTLGVIRKTLFLRS